MKPAEIQAQSDELEEALGRYLAYLQLERGASARTLSSYEADLRQLVQYWQGKGLRSSAEITYPHISGYLTALALKKVRPGRQAREEVNAKKTARPLSVASTSRKITTLRTFLKFLFAEGVLKEDFTERISGPRQKRKLPQTLTLAQYEKVLSVIKGTTPEALRDRALVELMFGSGLRISEVCGLKLTDVDEDGGFLRVFGKGSKERVVPVGTAALKALKAYLEDGRPVFYQHANVPFENTKKINRLRKPTEKLRGTGLIFMGWQGGALNRVSVWWALKKYAKVAGLHPSQLKPHGLRHSFATELLKGGADLRMIQGLLGHSSIATTQIYTAVEPTQLMEAHEKYHPRKGMKTEA